MVLTVTCITAVIALGAADLVWRLRSEADLRRRWRSRPRQPWHLT
jgi:hypothetical protein